MIKIIKPGFLAKATCDKCECIFTYEYEDISFGDQFDQTNLVECPCCGKLITSIALPKRKDDVR